MTFDTSLDLLIDTLSAPPWTSDSGGNAVSPNVVTGQLSGGGYFTAWATDINVDGLPDSIAVQRFTAQGNPTGSVVQLGELPIKQLVGSDADLRDLFSLDALNGGGYSLAYRVPVPAATDSWGITGANVGAGITLGFVGKPVQFTVSGTFSGLTFALRGAKGGIATDVPLTVVNNPDGTATITVSAANLSGFDNVERLGLRIAGTTQPTDNISIQAKLEENWRFFADNTTTTADTSITVSAGQTATVFNTTGRIDSFHINSATGVGGGQPIYTLSVNADSAVKQALGLFTAGQTVNIGGVTYSLNATGQILVGVTPDVNGNITVPAALRAVLEYHDAGVVLVGGNLQSGSTFSVTSTVVTPTVVTEGLHTRIYDATGALTFDHVIDTSAAPEWIQDLDGAASNPHVITGNLANGGYYVGWLADTNHDGLPEGVAVQKFAADGTTSGAVTLLGQLPILQLAGSEDDPAHLYDIEVLGGGGFAMSYEVPAPVDSVGQPALTAGSNGQASLFFVGKPHSFTISLGTGSLASATFALRGLNANGQQIDVAIGSNITAFTTLNVTAAQLAQFANPERVSLVVAGASAGATFGVQASLEPNWRYAGTEATATTHLTGTVQQIGTGFGAFLGSGSGRVESFHVPAGSVTAASGSPTYSMSVATDGEARANLGLFSVGQSAVHDGFTYTLQGNGIISVTGPFAPDGVGNIAVPTWLLSSLAYHDAGITLVIGNLAQNSSFAGDVTYRQPTVVTEGIHTRVYDSTGVLQFDNAINTSAAHEFVVDGSGSVINPNVTTGELSGGGYYTSWLADADGDGNPDGIGVQRYDAAGAPVGGVVELKGLPLKELEGTKGDPADVYSVDALTDGSYTASFNVQPPVAHFSAMLGVGTVVINSLTFNYANSFGIVGRPQQISVNSSTGNLTGLQFLLVGLNAQGQQVTTSLAMTGQGGAGSVTVSAADLAQFASPERLNFRITGMTNGQTVSVNGAALEDQRYFQDQPLVTTHLDATPFAVTLPGGTAYFGASGSTSRVESFHIASAVAAPGATVSYTLQITGSSDVAAALGGLTPGGHIVVGGITFTMQPNGVITSSVVTPDGGGNIAIPAQLLSWLEFHDVGIVLIAANLAQGSTFSTDVTTRTPYIVHPGIYTATYDAAGNQTSLHPTSGADNLLGGIAADAVNALAGNDSFHGGQGNDSLDGGTGVDVALYDGTRGSATVTRNATTHALTVSTTLDGADTLRHVEQVKFADGLYSFTFNAAGAAVVANFNPANGWASQDQNPRHLADVNGDGYLDIVGFGFAGVLVSFGSAAGTFSGAGLVVSNFGQTAGWSSDNGFHRELADVNGDGRADIIGFGFAGTLVSLAKADGTYDNPGTGIADFGVSQGWASQNGFARTVGDVNGDGKADIVGFGFAGALVALGNGNGTFQSVKTAIANFGVNQGWTSDNTFHRAVADVNGDGRADIVGFGFAGTYVALAKGDGTFADAQLVLNDFGTNQGWSNNDSFSRVVADVNGDHIADIVGFGIAGTLVAFGKGDGTFTQASLDVGDFGKNQGWSSDNTFHREMADLNHDGLADVVGFGIAGVLVGTNQGDFLI